MELYENKENSYIIVHGGYNYQVIDGYNVQNTLDDMWVFSISAGTWMKAFPNSDNNPSPRFGSSLTLIDENKLLLYGGMNSIDIYSDLWLFNIDSNMWIQINNPSSLAYTWPNPVKFFSITKFSKV
jgi:hypothetical protein